MSDQDPSNQENPQPDTDPVFQMHMAAMREMQEPRDGVSPTPVTYIIMCFLYLLWGGFYIGYYGGAWTGDGLAERQLGGPPPVLPPQDPMKLGKEVFNSCMQCHQESGLGIPGSYPPLAGSEYVVGDKRRVAAILLNGLSGDLTVKGQPFRSETVSGVRNPLGGNAPFPAIPRPLCLNCCHHWAPQPPRQNTDQSDMNRPSLVQSGVATALIFHL